MGNRIVFDIGANDGGSTFHMAEKGDTVFAFEPTPQMIKKIEDRIKNEESKLLNYFIFPYAVSNYNGKSEFYVAGQKDWGCSSLYEFSEGLDKTWPDRTDFKVTEKIEVEVIRLDTFIEKNNIKRIDYFHCDAQGSDLKVLQGLGKYINIIEEGVVEVAENKELSLYKGVDNTLLSMVEFLTSNGFRNLHITPWSNEYNIHFKRT